VPEADQDTACLLLNYDHLIDTGWNAAINMGRYGGDPMLVDYLFITHCHHDHYIGLPQLLFVHAMWHRRRPDRPPLTIVGPKPDVAMVVERAQSFLRMDQFPSVDTKPQVVALQAGDSYTTPRFDRPPLADHVRGVDLLVHEASRGPCESHPNDRGGHSGSIDAARIAQAGEVGKLGLIHYPSAARDKVLAAAQTVFPETVALQEGDKLRLA
jgi:ribonuclease Z